MPEVEVVFDLPDDIVAKILCRLPVRCLIQFSCVSKKWRSVIISDPKFAKSQLQIATEQRTLSHRVLVSTMCRVHEYSWESYPRFTGNSQLECLDDMSGDTFRVRSCTFPSEQHSKIVMASCNGLVILGSYYEDFSIWNPTTEFFRKIPDPQFPSSTKKISDAISGRYGFGYVSATDDYKLVLVIPDDKSADAELPHYMRKDLNVNILIFSVRANSWSTRRGGCRWSFPTGGWREHCGVLSNEAIYWCEACSEDDADGNLIEACYIYAFDLASEELCRVPVPAGLLQDVEESNHTVGIEMWVVPHLCGYLCLLYLSYKLYEKGDADVGLWIMRDYDVSDSWTKVFKFSEDHLTDFNDCVDAWHSYGSGLQLNSKMCFIMESGALVTQVSRKLVRIESRIGEKPVCSIPYRFEAPSGDWFDTTVYAESLVSIPESL